MAFYRKGDTPLSVLQLIALALGGMIGGGIFTILGVSVMLVGAYTPIAVLIGGLIAALAAYSYIKLGTHFQEEGAAYSFIKKVFPQSPFAASLVGWCVIFGYISSIALCAYTFSSYAISPFSFADSEWVRILLAGGIILFFAITNILSNKEMGELENVIVYAKLLAIPVLSFALINHSRFNFPHLFDQQPQGFPFLNILVVSSITYISYEGFHLVINAVNETDHPERKIPLAIYSAVALACGIYFFLALSAILVIPLAEIIANKETAFVAGTAWTAGKWGKNLVISCVLLATTSSISKMLFGASRLMAVIAQDGFFPAYVARRSARIPCGAITTLSFLAFFMVSSGKLRLIIEYGSITFLLVSLLMAYANFKIREQTNASLILTLLALFGLSLSVVLIIYYEFNHNLDQVFYITSCYAAIFSGAWFYSFCKKL